MGILGPKVLQAVIDLVTGGQSGGKTPTPFETYRNGTDLESFLRRCGVDFYLKEYEPRVPGTRRAIYEVNEAPNGRVIMVEIIETLVAEYAEDGDPAEMVEYLNERLLPDGFHLVAHEDKYRLMHVGEDFELVDDVEEAADGLRLDAIRSETDPKPNQQESETEDREIPREKDAEMVMDRDSGVDVSRNIFVVHGRDERIRSAMFEFLRSLDLRPLEWSELVKETGQGSPYVGEVLDKAFDRAQAVVVLLTPDDDAKLRDCFWKDGDPDYEKKLTPQARANVLFEAGMAMARQPRRTILVEIGTIRPFSDVGGRHALRFGDSIESRHELAQRLITAGCSANIKGRDWLRAGDFSGVYHDSENVDLQAFLFSKTFRLYYKPGLGGSKKMVFAPHGEIIQGANDKEHTWRIRDGKLEFLHEDGHVFSRFTYDRKTQIFNNSCDSDTTCRKMQHMKMDNK